MFSGKYPSVDKLAISLFANDITIVKAILPNQNSPL